MKKILTLLLVLGSFVVNAQNLLNYMDEFVEDANKYGASLFHGPPSLALLQETMTIELTSGEVVDIAALVKYEINSIFFSVNTHSYKKALKFLVYHELGHYYLHLEHNNSINEDGTPESIMHSSINVIWENITPEKQKGYLDELFKN